MTSASTHSTDHRLGWPVYVLAFGTFLMGTTEFVVAGLLPAMAGDLGVSVAHAGLTITVFAVGMIVGTPAMALLTLRMPRRRTLMLSLAVFSIGHVVAAMGSGLGVILAARFFTAVATGAFWSVAAVEGADLVDESMRSRALGVVLGGGMLANVVGVPLGAVAGQIAGWRGPFWALALVALPEFVLVWRVLPRREPTHVSPSVRAEVRGLGVGRLWLVLGACVCTTGGVLAIYSYISPLLTDRAGLPERWVPVVLIAFGAGALVGTLIGGRFGDLHPHMTALVAAAATAVLLVVFTIVSRHAVALGILAVPLGMFGLGANPILIGMAVRFAHRAPLLASALSTSSFNLGTAIGSWLAGRALESSLGALGPAVVGTAIGALTIVPVALVAKLERRPTQPS